MNMVIAETQYIASLQEGQTLSTSPSATRAEDETTKFVLKNWFLLFKCQPVRRGEHRRCAAI